MAVATANDIQIPYMHLAKRIGEEERRKLFNVMVDEYSKRFPNTHRVLAYLNWDPQSMVDYLYMMQTKNQQGKSFILYDLVFMGSVRSIPGFRYCVVHDLTEKFFLNGFEQSVPLELPVFDAIIKETLELSVDRKAPNFWKKRENIKPLIDHLTEMTIQYKPQITMS